VAPWQIVKNVSFRHKRTIAPIVVIGILAIRLKSINVELGPGFEEIDTDDWERRVICARWNVCGIGLTCLIGSRPTGEFTVGTLL
jgi:hypothetical protein